MNKIRIAKSKDFKRHAENFLVRTEAFSTEYPDPKDIDPVTGFRVKKQIIDHVDFHSEFHRSIRLDKCVFEILSTMPGNPLDELLDHFESSDESLEGFFVYAHN